MDLYFVMTPNGPALCKYRYLLEHALENHPHRYLAFLGPLAHQQAVKYLEPTFPTLWPAAEVQVNELVVGPYDHRVLTHWPERFPQREADRIDS